jgi:DNA-binding MarR family transcriptional regulator
VTAVLPAAPATAELAGRLRLAASRIARDGLSQRRVDGMTPSRMTALSVLAAEGPLRIGELATRLGISAPTVSRLVDVLAERGLLKRVTDETDHRATRVRLSADGQAGLAAVREHGASLLAARIDALDAADRAAIGHALPALERLSGIPQSGIPLSGIPQCGIPQDDLA